MTDRTPTQFETGNRLLRINDALPVVDSHVQVKLTPEQLQIFRAACTYRCPWMFENQYLVILERESVLLRAFVLGEYIGSTHNGLS